MTSKSFRKDLGPPPYDFRTPSPPPFELLTPITPTTTAWSAAWVQGKQRKPAPRRVDKPQRNGTRGRKRKSSAKNARQNVMDDFASIALLANGKNEQRPNLPRGEYDEASHQRPSKRAKSEHIATSDEARVYSRPHTSYHAQTTVETADAELLLNFSRIASSEASNARRNGWQPAVSSLTNAPGSRSDHAGTWYGDRAEAPQSSGQVTHQDGPSRDTQGSSQPERHSLRDHEQNTNYAQPPPPSVAISIAPTSVGPVLEQDVVENETAGPSKAEEFTDGSREPTATVIEPIVDSTTHNEQDEGSTSRQFLERIEGARDHGISNVEEQPIPENATESAPSTSKQSQRSPSICAGCNFHRNSLALESENEADSWISCDGCKSWFHFACAGFKSEREVRSVDKFRCRQCKSIYGPTTYVRKSSRAHSAIDYAGLNEGIVKTSDENPLHHYIKPIKDGTIKFDPESFARMRPELITRDLFEKGDGMREPIVIPAEFNPRPRQIPDPEVQTTEHEKGQEPILDDADIHDTSILQTWRGEDYEFEQVEDNGQDALDMVIPIGLTVRKVSELYGPDEKIDVIDVKSQNGEDKKWTMRRWVDYYESKGSKKVRNVISLEVSQSKLGALIQRPKVVRDLDLQDSVWPSELIAKGDYPKVQFYCLMSVADCYTDFHIDFGGSSVYYHILQGKKTFFFIPPHEKHLKKYEEWCNSPAQNWTFLGDQTKECYRVDLSAGDTMLIPAGWIHAVWTPEDSLVIGGNFLTRLNLPMQIRVTQIEKATFVDRKFRYPYFQKVMWYTALRYLEDDPIPDSVVTTLVSGQPFRRDIPTYLDFDGTGDTSTEGPENFYHPRYYSKAELDGLPELARYLQRTALIAMGIITEGITTKTQEAVKRSIPKGNGDPLQTVKNFALWYTWKRGNETIPHWAYPDYVPEGAGADSVEKKLSAKAMKKLDREAAMQALKVAPDRQSTRVRTQPQTLLAEMVANQSSSTTPKRNSPSPNQTPTDSKGTEESLVMETPGASTPSKKPRADGGGKTPSGRRPACDACRKGRRACKHREAPITSSPNLTIDGAAEEPAVTKPRTNGEDQAPASSAGDAQTTSPGHGKLLQMEHLEIVQQNGNIGGYISRLAGPNDSTSIVQAKASGRSKACKDCRKSKRRCVHDEFGNEDPVKLAEAAIPRPAAKKRKPTGEPMNGTNPKRPKKSQNAAPEVVFGNGSGQVNGLTDVAPDDVKASLTQIADGALRDLAASANAAQAYSQAAEPRIIEDDVHIVATSPVSEIKYDISGTSEHVVAANGQGHGASSLVSPPESTHTDAERTPPASAPSKTITPPAAAHTAPASVQPPKTTPRFTPDSNAHGQASTDGDAASPTASVEATTSTKRRVSRLGSDHGADEESLKLIRQLAAQDMGLRRRAKVV